MKKLLYILLITVLAGCYEDESFFIRDENIALEHFIVTNFIGVVTDDETGEPIVDAVVYNGMERKETDDNGVFYFNDLEVNTRKAGFTVEKQGYHSISRTVSVNTTTRSNRQIINFILTRKQEIGTFAATDGRTISLPGGAVLDIPTNAFGDYIEEVAAFGSYFLQTQNKANTAFPNDMLAVNMAGQERILDSYGIVSVRFEKNDGSELVDFATPVIVRIPVDHNLNPPASLPVWYLDDDGIWKEGGMANLQGDEYVAEISQNGYWSFANAYAVANISGKVIRNGVPVGNMPIGIRMNSGVIQTHLTNTDGFYNAKVPIGESLTIGIYQSNCNLLQPSFEVVPTATPDNSVMAIADLNAPDDLIRFSGTIINCENESVTDGYVILDQYQVVQIEDTEMFTGFLPPCTETVSLTGLDGNGNVLANELAIATDLETTILALACPTNPEYVNINYDGNQSVAYVDEQSTYFEAVAVGEDGILSVETNSGIFEIAFQDNEQGTYNVTSLQFTDLVNDNIFIEVNPDAQVTLNQNVSRGSYLTGTIDGSFTDINGQMYPLNGAFRVKRDN